jgi:hypothetical protein
MEATFYGMRDHTAEIDFLDRGDRQIAPAPRIFVAPRWEKGAEYT